MLKCMWRKLKFYIPLRDATFSGRINMTFKKRYSLQVLNLIACVFRLTGKKRYPELSHYNLIRRMREKRKMQWVYLATPPFVHRFYKIISFHFRATVRPATEPIEEKSTENKITTPAPLNEESLQLHSIISDISVISDPRLLIPAKTNLKQVKVETSEQATNLGLTNSLENLNMPVTNVDSEQQHQQAANLLTT